MGRRTLVTHLTATTCVGVVGGGVCKLSISNGWPGPQPAIQHRITATTISISIVFIISLSKKAQRFFLERATAKPNSTSTGESGIVGKPPCPCYYSCLSASAQGCSSTSPWHCAICSGVHSAGFASRLSGIWHFWQSFSLLHIRTS